MGSPGCWGPVEFLGFHTMKPATWGLLQELEIVPGGLFRCPFLDLGWASHGEGRICFFCRFFFSKESMFFKVKVKEQSDSSWGGDEIMMVMEMMIMIMIMI